MTSVVYEVLDEVEIVGLCGVVEGGAAGLVELCFERERSIDFVVVAGVVLVVESGGEWWRVVESEELYINILLHLLS